MTRITALDRRHGEAVDRLALLGVLGADLNALAVDFELPVPPGFTLTPTACAELADAGWDATVGQELDEAVAELEERTACRFGDARSPLLVSVRPGATVELPGLTPSVLDVGLDDQATRGLAERYGRRFALDTRLHLVRSFAQVVGGISEAPFDSKLADARRFADVATDEELPEEVLELLVPRFEAVAAGAGATLPDTPLAQLRYLIQAAVAAWNSDQGEAIRRRHGAADAGLAITVQAMVFGNRADDSGSGRFWSHDPLSGQPGTSGSLRRVAQGGRELPGEHSELGVEELRRILPDAMERVDGWLDRLHRERLEVVGLDVTLDAGELFVLGSRRGAPSATAALRVLVDQVDQGVFDAEQALARVRPRDLESVMHASVDLAGATVLARGLGASPGAASGEVCLDADRAAARAAAGAAVILVKQETSPEDINGMSAAAGIVTTRGGLASHAAVVARGWGTPAVCGVEAIELGEGQLRVGEQVVSEGEWLTIDGTSGQVVLGSIDVSEATWPAELETILGWADQVRSDQIGVRANADTATDAARARELGAEGIGLCRTEHMFLAEDRLPLVRDMILAPDERAEAAALRKLRRAQKADFMEILEAMDGCAVTVRLLDPPLHEFLPDPAELMVAEATGELDERGRSLLVAARAWSEVNPMIGTRGVRLGYLKPGLYEMQVAALVDAAVARRQAGGDPRIEIMIPLTVSGPELAGARRWVSDALAAKGAVVESLDIKVGTMIETPRAALCAPELAEQAEFFSFGTNDLTQLTYGFSRDDVEGRLMATYLDRGLLPANPFERLDPEGVGRLVRLAATEARERRPELKLGVCGEHGGDPASIAVLVDAGVDYVSCSPLRVPLARLAVAQALLAGRAADQDLLAGPHDAARS